MLIIKEYSAMGFKWRLLLDRKCHWFYLERDGKIISEGTNRTELLKLGWYY